MNINSESELNKNKTTNSDLGAVSGSVSWCKSYQCKECKHYVKFLKCNTMHTICWNKDNWFEKLS